MNANTAAVILVVGFIAGGIYLIVNAHPWLGGLLLVAACGVSVNSK